jgi:hypothetical protein
MILDYTSKLVHDHAEIKFDGQVYHVSIETYDAERAAEALRHNDGNRKIKNSVVRRYAQDMKMGLWTLTGEAVVFDNSGNMRNGQHRMSAAAQYATSFTTLVFRGVAPATMRDMDQGTKRTAADDLGLKGEMHTTILSALIAAYMIFEATDAGYAARNSGAWSVSKSAIQAYFAYDQERADKLRSAAEFYDRGIVPAPYVFRTSVVFPLVYMHMLDAGISEDAAREFFNQLRTGNDLRNGSPVKALRERLIQAKGDRETLTGLQVAHMLITAWNHYRAGNDVTQIKVYDPSSLARLKVWPRIAV